MEKPENMFIKHWFNSWDLPDKEYHAQELYDNYKLKKGNGYVVTLVHFGKMLRKLAAAGRLNVRSLGGKALYYNPLHKEDDVDSKPVHSA